MRKLLLLSILGTLIGGLASFIGWAERRPPSHYLSDLRGQLSSDRGTPGEAGNLLLIRPQLFPADYRSPAHLRLKLAAALDRARAAGLLGPRTLVLLPEHIGTWLIAAGEKSELYRARDRKEVRDWMLLGNPLLALRVLVRNLDAERLDEALLRMKAKRMAADYQQLFSGLAREYRVTLLAGSILLPAPYLHDGELSVGDGPLRTLSLAFGPDGQPLGEPFSEAWPQPTDKAEPQRLHLAGRELLIERDWQPGYPQSRVRVVGGDQLSEPLYLRGTLSWPVGGAPRRVELTPLAMQRGQAPGSQLLNLWIAPR
jgi:hypothetical protein